jgi:hypothetical protein
MARARGGGDGGGSGTELRRKREGSRTGRRARPGRARAVALE